MLLGFARVDLDAGEQAKVTFEVSADRFAYCGRQGRVVDSGAIELMFGHSSTDIAHRALLEVTGTTRKVGSERTLTTPVVVGFDAPPGEIDAIIAGQEAGSVAQFPSKIGIVKSRPRPRRPRARVSTPTSIPAPRWSPRTTPRRSSNPA